MTTTTSVSTESTKNGAIRDPECDGQKIEQKTKLKTSSSEKCDTCPTSKLTNPIVRSVKDKRSGTDETARGLKAQEGIRPPPMSKPQNARSVSRYWTSEEGQNEILRQI